jgi:hypothetical protein
MGGFFHGWRRKLGVVTLVVACMFAALWVRSPTIDDRITFPTFCNCSCESESIFGRLVWQTVISEDTEYDLSLRSTQWGDGMPPRMFGDDGLFYFHRNGREGSLFLELCIPHWSIVIPLTLLSAWLLLSKPRSKMSTTI